MKTDGEQRQILSSQRQSLSLIRIRFFTSFRVDPGVSKSRGKLGSGSHLQRQ